MIAAPAEDVGRSCIGNDLPTELAHTRVINALLTARIEKWNNNSNSR